MPLFNAFQSPITIPPTIINKGVSVNSFPLTYHFLELALLPFSFYVLPIPTIPLVYKETSFIIYHVTNQNRIRKTRKFRHRKDIYRTNKERLFI